MNVFVGIAGLGLVLLAGWFVWTFNRLVRQRNHVKKAWSGIDVQLKRRSDLVPSLVETVKGYAGHERALLEEVTRLRSQAQSAGDIAQRGGAESALSQGIRHLFAVAEQYPELKADRNFLDLQKNLARLEDDLQMARRYYNGTVRDLNNLVESVPSNLVAVLAGFRGAEFFELETVTEREAPAVKLS